MSETNVVYAGTDKYADVNRDVVATLGMGSPGYWALVALVVSGVAYGGYCWAQQLIYGLGVAGLNHPVGWASYITNFVFWVGIAHSGTLISAVLYLFRAPWRQAIYRASEAMTVFAVMTAGLFPIIHVGRAWNAYWLIPYPNQRQLWVNFRSPLLWDVFAISTYMTISIVFFYVGLIPDIAAARDGTTGIRKQVYRVLALGWRNSHKQWRHYSLAYLLFASFAFPLVVSVHSIVSWDFATGIVPGWHSTIFAPYFVAGAIFSGLAMVVTILVPLRKGLKLEKYIMTVHFDAMAKMILFTGSIVAYAYMTEWFIAWYSDVPAEREIFWFRAFGGAYSSQFWLMVLCNCLIPQLLWFKKIRTSLLWLFPISIAVNIGMWMERFNIIVSSLSHEYVPGGWGSYELSVVEIGITIGAFCWFFMFFLLFIKQLPSVAIMEVKEIMAPPMSKKSGHHGGAA